MKPESFVYSKHTFITTEQQLVIQLKGPEKKLMTGPEDFLRDTMSCSDTSPCLGLSLFTPPLQTHENIYIYDM